MCGQVAEIFRRSFLGIVASLCLSFDVSKTDAGKYRCHSLCYLCHGAVAACGGCAFKKRNRGAVVQRKTALNVGEDRLQILVNGSKRKKIVYDFSYDQLEKFYFISNGSKLNKDTGKFYVKEGASGSINFNVGKTFYCAAVYHALPAAEYILQKLQDSQIDWTSNELEQDGTHCPKW